MPLYCKYEAIANKCQVNENDPVIQAFDQMIAASQCGARDAVTCEDKTNPEMEICIWNESAGTCISSEEDLKTSFTNNCTPLDESTCAIGSVATFCERDVATNTCKAVSKTSLGLAEGENDDSDVSAIQAYCEKLDTESCENRACESTQILSETGQCVQRPWYDYTDCATEIKQGACPHGNDPNPDINQYCIYTCTSDFILGPSTQEPTTDTNVYSTRRETISTLTKIGMDRN